MISMLFHGRVTSYPVLGVVETTANRTLRKKVYRFLSVYVCIQGARFAIICQSFLRALFLSFGMNCRHLPTYSTNPFNTGQTGCGPSSDNVWYLWELRIGTICMRINVDVLLRRLHLVQDNISRKELFLNVQFKC